jgi:Fibronectin type III domain
MISYVSRRVTHRNAAVVSDEPSAPRNLRVKDYWTDFITIMWENPQSDGGSPITGYVIEKRDASRPTWVKAGTVDADCAQFKATNLFEGVDYLFRVYAVNKVGPSREPAELDQPCKAKMPFGKMMDFLYLLLLTPL